MNLISSYGNDRHEGSRLRERNSPAQHISWGLQQPNFTMDVGSARVASVVLNGHWRCGTLSFEYYLSLQAGIAGSKSFGM